MMPAKRSWLERMICLAACMTLVSVASASVASPAVISSTFDTGTDGWVAMNILDDGSILNPADVLWSASGGNPDGCIWRSDYGPVGYGFSAPAKFLGDKSEYIGGTLSWDMKNNLANYDGGPSTNHLNLIGGGLNIVHWGEYPNSNTWTHIDISLRASDGWTRVVDGDWRAPLTDEQFAIVLANLEIMWFNADWGWDTDTSSLDNVVMQVPEPGCLAILGIGVIGMLQRRRGARR